ncbi:MAG TPA: beta-galactosidase, partial [Bacillota bacterium]|nr:beta-galactosidase [Bacillota bacterium]
MGMRFGVDYYPEQWARERWQSDLQRMKAMGFSVIRVMEFAWTLLEPEEGRYDFSLFDDFISEAQSQKFQIILGTPTATFPAWLYEKNPRIVQTHPDGSQEDFGTRRQACLNAPDYLEAALKVVQAVGKHFGDNPTVTGWQIDNEVGHEGSDHCVCPNCQEAWHRWLKKRYTTIDALNKAWGTVFWGTTYTKFYGMGVEAVQRNTNDG